MQVCLAVGKYVDRWKGSRSRVCFTRAKLLSPSSMLAYIKTLCFNEQKFKTLTKKLHTKARFCSVNGPDGGCLEFLQEALAIV